MRKSTWAVSVVIALIAGSASAQNWNPRPGWKDSYAVDGVCYCDSNGFDHGIGNKSYDTPAGRLSIPQICSDIQSVLGSGRRSGRIPYNDIQCGNGPANNAADETGCPGRVDIGSRGCDQIGPKWDLDAVYGDPDPDPVDPPSPPPTDGGVSATASRNSGSANLAIDGKQNTRWTTNETQRPGQYFELDLGETQSFNQVVLDTSRSSNDEPAGYTLAVSNNGRSFQNVASGNGNGGVTTIGFPDQSARYIRITQTGSKSRNWWSIHELQVNSNSSDAPPPPTNGEPLDRSSWTMVASRNNTSTYNAIDGNENSRWTTVQTQRAGQSFEIDLGSTQSFSRIELDTSGSGNDFPRGYNVLVSNNGNNWSTVSSGTGNGAVSSISVGEQNARYIRIDQTGSHGRWWWSIHEVNIFR